MSAVEQQDAVAADHAARLTDWLQHYDPVHRGWTPRGIANGLSLTQGFFYPRLAGGYNLYRVAVEGAGPVGAAALVGAASGTAREIERFAWLPAEPGGCQAFEVRSVGGGGVESAAGGDAIAVCFDGQGRAVDLRPNPPWAVRVQPCAGGRFEIRWRYGLRDEQVSPAWFEILACDQVAGAVTVLGAVAHAAWREDYVYRSPPYAHDAVVGFRVQAVSAAGVTSDAPLAAFGRADAVAPPPQAAGRVRVIAEPV